MFGKQLLIVSIVTIVLATMVVVVCASGAVNATNPSLSPHATASIPAVTGFGNATDRGDVNVNLAPDIATAFVIAAIALAGVFA
jgi:hypothetical protein